MYKQEKKKLDARCDRGIFIGYDRNGPAYMVYYPDSGKIQKHRLVKFLTKSDAEQETQTYMFNISLEDDDFRLPRRARKVRHNTNVKPESKDSQPQTTKSEEDTQTHPNETDHEQKRYRLE